MNADEAMAEMAAYMESGRLGTRPRLGALERYIVTHTWWLRLSCGASGVPDETARCYLTGWLQEWLTKLEAEDARNNVITLDENLRYRVQHAWGCDQFLPALWECYKSVNGITVG